MTLRMEDSIFPQNLTLDEAAVRLGTYPDASLDVILEALAATLTSDADAYLGYTDGNWPTYAAVLARFPSKPVLSMAVFASGLAEGYDGEPGDITPAAMPGCVRKSLAAGYRLPVVYASVSNVPAYLAALHAAGLAQGSDFRLLSAHYGSGQHVCGPATCGWPGVPACDGTQWTDAGAGAAGSLIDLSALNDDFFTGGAVSATGPASWDAADKTAFAAITDANRDYTAAAGLWWLDKALRNTVTTGMSAPQAALVRDAHAALTALLPAVPDADEIAAAVVAALPPGTAGLTQEDVEAAVRAVFAEAAVTPPAS
jgi:hypothetical protein